MFVEWLGDFGPAFSAILVSALYDGRDGVRDLLSRLFIWRVNVKWYLIALFLTAVGALGVIAFYVLTDRLVGSLPGIDFWRSTFHLHVMLFIGGTLVGTFIVGGEELGWRGYALPILQDRYHPLVSSVILGFFWGLWHSWNPMYRPATGDDVVDILILTGGTISASVIYTWLHNNTRGSVLIACLFHAAYDLTLVYAAGIIPFPPNIRGVDLVLLAVLATIVIIMAGPSLSRQSQSVAEA